MVMFQRDFWRTGRWHAISAEFIITNGPDAILISDTILTIRWTMSEVASGRVEYGLTSAYGSATIEQSISGGYTTHVQSITGLVPGVTYHYRTKSTSASGVTVYSSDQVVQTTGQPLPVGVGPRYGLFGSGGPFPALPASYVLVPASVPQNGGVDCSAALAAFLNDTTLVPDGASPAAPTYVVFDRTLLGSGTTYYLDNNVLLRKVGVVRRNIVFWGYNTKIVHRGRSGEYTSRFLNFDGGGYREWDTLGFWFEGPNPAAGTWACRSLGTESGHAITVTAYEGFRVKDCYAHNLMGEFFNGTQWDHTDALHDPTSTGPQDLDVSYNRVDGTARQGIVVNQGVRNKVHHNIVENPALACFDAEDWYSPYGKFVDLEITDNVFRRWNWHLTTSSWFVAQGLLWTYQVGDTMGEMRNLTISRNRWEEGAMGRGNPSAEIAVLGSSISDGYDPVIWFKTNGLLKQNVVITDNVFDLPADQDRSRVRADYGEAGNAVIIDNVATLTITGNDFGNRGVYYRNASGVTVSGVTGIVDGA